MQISAAKMLYLVIDKMSKCNKGMKEVAKQYKKELDRIIGGLNNLHKRAFNCVTFKFGIGKNAYNNCIGYFFTIKDDLLNYQKRLDILLKNPKLFAQPTRTRYGQSKGYCVNIEVNHLDIQSPVISALIIEEYYLEVKRNFFLLEF